MIGVIKGDTRSLDSDSGVYIAVHLGIFIGPWGR